MSAGAHGRKFTKSIHCIAESYLASFQSVSGVNHVYNVTFEPELGLSLKMPVIATEKINKIRV